MKCSTCQKEFALPFGQPLKMMIGKETRDVIVYSCPLCQTVINCECDPLPVASFIVSQIETYIDEKR